MRSSIAPYDGAITGPRVCPDVNASCPTESRDWCVVFGVRGDCRGLTGVVGVAALAGDAMDMDIGVIAAVDDDAGNTPPRPVKPPPPLFRNENDAVARMASRGDVRRRSGECIDGPARSARRMACRCRSFDSMGFEATFVGDVAVV